MNDELDKALEYADYGRHKDSDVPKHAAHKIDVLADAVRSLRETVKAREEEIERLKLSWDSAESQIDDVDAELREVVKENADLRKKLHEAGINPSLDDALNRGDGSYKP